MSQNASGSILEAEIALKKAIEDGLVRIRKALEDRNLTKVAQATGLHENTVRNIAKGNGGTPTVETIEKLSNYLFSQSI